jgi:hypothetical protein
MKAVATAALIDCRSSTYAIPNYCPGGPNIEGQDDCYMWLGSAPPRLIPTIKRSEPKPHSISILNRPRQTALFVIAFR